MPSFSPVISCRFPGVCSTDACTGAPSGAAANATSRTAAPRAAPRARSTGGTSTYPQISGGGGYQKKAPFKAPLSSSSPQNTVWVLLSTYQQLQHQLLRGLDGRGNRLPRVEPRLGSAAHTRQALKIKHTMFSPLFPPHPVKAAVGRGPSCTGSAGLGQTGTHRTRAGNTTRFISPCSGSHQPKPAALADRRQAAPGAPRAAAAPSAASGRPDPRGHATSSLFS